MEYCAFELKLLGLRQNFKCLTFLVPSCCKIWWHLKMQLHYKLHNIILIYIILLYFFCNIDGQNYVLVPPDGGWGWLVLLGSTLVNMLIPGTLKSFGVLFVEFTEAFHASETAASWIPAICYFLYCSLGEYYLYYILLYYWLV